MKTFYSVIALITGLGLVLSTTTGFGQYRICHKKFHTVVSQCGTKLFVPGLGTVVHMLPNAGVVNGGIINTGYGNSELVGYGRTGFLGTGLFGNSTAYNNAGFSNGGHGLVTMVPVSTNWLAIHSDIHPGIITGRQMRATGVGFFNSESGRLVSASRIRFVNLNTGDVHLRSGFIVPLHSANTCSW